MSIADKLTALDTKVDDVYEAGKTKEWSDFWDAYQNFGNRTDYYYGFQAWMDGAFEPKYDIIPTRGTRLFYASTISDIKGALERNGVILDTSKCPDFMLLCQGNGVNKRFPILNTINSPGIDTTFSYNYSLESIDKIILSESGEQVFPYAFHYCTSLKDIVIEGIIGRDISFEYSPLSIDSCRSVINALKNYSGTSTTYTLTLSETSKGYLTETDIAQITQKGWTLA